MADYHFHKNERITSTKLESEILIDFTSVDDTFCHLSIFILVIEIVDT